jgi:hypothetical protein
VSLSIEKFVFEGFEVSFLILSQTQVKLGEATMLLADARRVIGSAEKKAAEIGQPMNIAVDEGGNLIAHVRMDGAWLGSIDISIKKAYTARAFDISTRDLAGHSQSGDSFRHSRFERRSDHDFRGWYSVETQREGSGRNRG